MTATRKRQQPAAPETSDPVEGGYRCAECGHGERLWAWASANAYGPLAADGSELAEHVDVAEWGIHEDSIQCEEHPGAVIEQFVKGRWCRWWACPRCNGHGRIADRPGGREWECPKESPFGRWGAHQAWLPVEEHPAA